MEWHQIVDKVSPFVFKVETPRGSGTGFLFAYGMNKNLCGVATAAHVVEDADKWGESIDVTHFESGKTTRLLPGPQLRAIVVDRDRDTASITFPKRDLKLPADLLSLIPADQHLKVGVELGWLGFPAVPMADLCFFSGSVSNWIGERKFYFVDGVAINGVSGGPAFYFTGDDKPVTLAGVISAYIPNRATGEPLPGLLVVRDVTLLHSTIQAIRTIEEAIEEDSDGHWSAASYLDRTSRLSGPFADWCCRLRLHVVGPSSNAADSHSMARDKGGQGPSGYRRTSKGFGGSEGEGFNRGVSDGRAGLGRSY